MKALQQTSLWRSLVVAATLTLIYGCSGEPLTMPLGPLAPGDAGSNPEASGSPPDTTDASCVYVQPSEFLTDAAGDPATDVWYFVASGTVTPLLGGTVSGSRYTVQALPGAVVTPTTLMIMERDPGVIDFQLLPHGKMFLVPVVLTVDYSGTNADPNSPTYDGSAPSLVWLNPSTNLWELVVSVNHPETCTNTAVLPHFSRYACKGTAEW